MNPPGKLRALLATLRVANLPSVVSNVMFGVFVGVSHIPMEAAPDGGRPVAGMPWATSLKLVFAGCLLYLAGNLWNDWKDRDWDAVRRPERALPRGLFRPSAYLAGGTLFAAFGCLLAWTVRPWAFAVAGLMLLFIGIYTAFHKRHPWSVIAVAACRALLVVFGALGTMSDLLGGDEIRGFLAIVAIAAVPLLAYVAGISLTAKGESQPLTHEPRRWAACMLLFFPVLVLASGLRLLTCGSWSDAAVGSLPFLLWTSYCWFRASSVRRRVSGLLAGIPLVDWMFLLTVLLHGAGHGLGFGITEMVVLSIPPLAFGSALLLQRLAPAT